MHRSDAAMAGRLVVMTLLTSLVVVSSILLCPLSAHALEKATLQLKWLHHFQFAGYYMALEKGYYRDVGLDVTILEGGPSIDVDKEVESGRADFGVGTSALLLNLAKGQDFVVLGQIFQHSPAIFLTLRRTGIHSVSEMAGKRFMHFTQHGDMQALLKRYGIKESDIVKVPQKGNPRDLIEGKADIMLAYSFNEPYIMELAGEPYYAFSPLSFGIDFYGDNFFTTGRMVAERPAFVKAFRDATLRGWSYALENKGETVDLIHAQYPRGMSREHLLFEADGLDNLIQPQLVELGYQSLSRWRRISETFADLGMIPKGFDPAPIIYVPHQIKDYGPLVVVVLLSGGVIAVLTWLLLTFRRLNAKLKGEVDERRRAEQELDETQQLFDLFLKHTPVYTFLKEIDGEQSRVLRTSDNFIEMVGIPAEKMRGRTMAELFPAEFARKITLDDLTVMKEGKVVQMDEDFGGRSYTTIKFPIFRGGKASILAGFTIDITERKRSEALLRESEERFRLAFENANAGMCLVDMQGILFKVNRQMSEIFGYSREELEGMSVNDIAHPDHRQVSTAFIHEAGNGLADHAVFEKAYLHKDGNLVWGQVSSSLVRNAAGEPLYFISHVIDITGQKQAVEERLAMERQLLNSQKMESLGVLAGGVAHDFNNILMAIIGNADLALMKLDPESPVAANIRQIEQAATRAADLARQMLAYSGKGKFVVEQLDLNRMLTEMLHMLEASIARRGVLHLDLSPGIPSMEADAGQMRQLIMNLVINAAEAIGDHDGRITITTGYREYPHGGTEEGWLKEAILPGRYVCMEVADSGCGMDNETLDRIFEPFFTTKFTGRGLGMAAALGIVRGHQGGIRVQSKPGRGTTVTLLFPAAGLPVCDALERFEDDWRGHGTVLLVDDEETVREIGAELLRELGFTPITACNGTEAIEICRSRQGIDLVILDLTMPNMDGEQCFRELQHNWPGMKVIMSSGYNRQDVTQRFVGKGLAGFIQKPYKLFDLKEALRLVM